MIRVDRPYVVSATDTLSALQRAVMSFTASFGEAQLYVRICDEGDNPTPAYLEDQLYTIDVQPNELELLVLEQQKETARLCELAGVENIEDATYLEMEVDTSQQSLSTLGEACLQRMPRLQELKLNNSFIQSLRDLGTALQQLQVLWVARCGLTALDGLAALPALRELYAAFNDIADLSDLQGLEQLEVLDLEGNCVQELEDVEYLAMCPSLHTLSLASTPVASSPGYSAKVLLVLPQLQILDDQCCSNGAGSGGQAADAADWDIRDPQGHMALQEMSMVNDGIKRARVGVDSTEFEDASVASLLGVELEFDTVRQSLNGMWPAGTSGWMRVLRSSHQELGAMRISCSSLTSSRPQSGSCSLSSRPTSATSRLSAEAEPPGTSSGRPPSGRRSSAGSRPSSAQSTPGLYWRKHRLDAAAGSVLSGAADLVQVGSMEDADAASSCLTHGSDRSLGGNVARGLRKWKSSNPDAVAESAEVLMASPRLEAEATTVDRESLLEQLRRWKLETADKVLLDDQVGQAASWITAAREDEGVQQEPAGCSSANELHSSNAAPARLAAGCEANTQGAVAAAPAAAPAALPAQMAAGGETSAQGGAAAAAAGPGVLPAPRVPASRMVLCKAMQDARRMQQRCSPSSAVGPYEHSMASARQQQWRRSSSSRTSAMADAGDSHAALPSPGPSGRQPQGSRPLSVGSARLSSSSGSDGRSESSCCALPSVHSPPTSRDMSRSVSACSAWDGLDGPVGSTTPKLHARLPNGTYSVLSIGGACDLRSINPQPVARYDLDSDSDG